MLRAKRYAKMKKNQQSSDQEKQSSSTCEADQARSAELDNISQVTLFSQNSHYLSILCYACIYSLWTVLVRYRTSFFRWQISSLLNVMEKVNDKQR